jgi:hypothetical protein
VGRPVMAQAPHMGGLRILLIVRLTGAFACAAVARPLKANTAQAALDEAFDPDRIFKGEIRPNSDDEVILTALVGIPDGRIPSIPDYSLAIAYRCIDDKASHTTHCCFTARMLRAGVRPEDRQWAGQARFAKDAGEMRSMLDTTGPQWLEADVDACPNGIHAMDTIRIASWNPDTHYALLPMKDRQVILDPSMTRVSMKGTYVTSTYYGWAGANGVPVAVRKLTETLEPCWKPATAPRPWRRR